MSGSGPICRFIGIKRSLRRSLESGARILGRTFLAPDSKLLAPVSGLLHFRGFSRMYRRGGRYGPHWFDYDHVATESPWRPITGAATRFGDVKPLLDRADAPSAGWVR